MERQQLHLRFLMERGLLGHEEARNSLAALQKLKSDLNRVLAHERDPALVERVEAAWRRYPFDG